MQPVIGVRAAECAVDASEVALLGEVQNQLARFPLHDILETSLAYRLRHVHIAQRLKIPFLPGLPDLTDRPLDVIPSVRMFPFVDYVIII
jgi:hypothetical protein